MLTNHPTSMTPHPYRLRAYHNPDKVPFSAIPPGWRFLYADEVGRPQNKPCRKWFRFKKRFHFADDFIGNSAVLTYIVPVAAP